MTKSVYELLTLIEAYNKYGQLASCHKIEEHKKYFLTLQKRTLQIIMELSNQKHILLPDFDKFYKEAYQYLEEENEYSLILKSVLNPVGETASIIDSLWKQDEIEGIYGGYQIPYNTTRALLFNRIMGKKALSQKPEIEQNMGLNILSTLKENREYYFYAVYHYWNQLLKDLEQEEKITKEQQIDYLINLEYLSNYYWNLKMGQDRMLNLSIKLDIWDE